MRYAWNTGWRKLVVGMLQQSVHNASLKTGLNLPPTTLKKIRAKYYLKKRKISKVDLNVDDICHPCIPQPALGACHMAQRMEYASNLLSLTELDPTNTMFVDEKMFVLRPDTGWV